MEGSSADLSSSSSCLLSPAQLEEEGRRRRMGSMAAHISAFLLLFPVGIRRLLSSYSLHLRPTPSSPAHYYIAKPWYFASEPPSSSSAAATSHRDQNQNNPQQRLLLLLKNLDLYALLVALPIAAFSELFLFLTLAQPLQRLPFSHQSAALALFWLLLLAISLRNDPAPSAFPDDLVFVLAALAFLAEIFLTGRGAGVGPIEDRVYGLLSVLTLTCAASCLVLAACRTAFAADVALSAGLAFKGTWALQAGWCLFGVPPKGCHWGMGGGSLGRAEAGLVCELEEDRLRGLALVDLLFSVHAVGIAGGCLALLSVVARRVNRAAAGETESSSGAMMWPMIAPELEIDY